MSLTGKAESNLLLKGKIEKVPLLDKTLTKEGECAEAKATGEAIEQTLEDSKAYTDGILQNFTNHGQNKENPHEVTAEQVGARPNTWMPTAEQVGARPNTWTPNSVDVGAAPAIEDATYAGCYYRMVGGEKEWINPPMVLGEEYRTTERYKGDPVYKKVISYTLESNVSASGLTDLGIPTGITEFKEPVSYSADLNDSVLLPYIGGTGHVGLVKFEGPTVTLRASNQSMSAGEIVEIRLAYTKTTD